MKRILAMVLSLALVATMAIGGSIAYLTDGEGIVNVMAVGNVNIEQIELQRAEGVPHNQSTTKEGDLIPFVQDQKLYPAVPVNGKSSDYTAEATELFSWHPYTTSQTAANGLWDDDNLIGAMDKFIFVKNTGKSDAYFRTIIAFECPEGMEYSQGSDKELMMNTNQSKTYYYCEDIGYTEIEGTRYRMLAWTGLKPLAAGTTSNPSLLQVVMTHNATNEDMALLGDTYEILAFSQAVQVDNMDAAYAQYVENCNANDKANEYENAGGAAAYALERAFGKITATEHPWKDGVQMPVFVDTADELKDALTNGGTVVLEGNIEVGGDLNMDEGATLNGNGYTLTNAQLYMSEGSTVQSVVFDGTEAEKGSNIYAHDVSVTIENCTFDSPNWEAIQFTSETPNKTIEIKDCTFTYTAASTYSARSVKNRPYRYVHVELTNKPVGSPLRENPNNGVKLVMTNNHFENIDVCTDDGITVVGVRPENITLSGNTATAETAEKANDECWFGIIGYDAAGKKEWQQFYPEVFKFLATEVSGAADLAEKLESGNDVVLTEDVTAEAETTAPYGNKVGFIHNGGVFDGGNNTLSVECYGDDYGVMTSGGTIKNLTIDEGCRAIMIMSPTEDIILDNVHACGDILYPLNTGEHATVEGIDLIVTNSSFGGWSSFDGGMETASFTDCDFVVGGYDYGWPVDSLIKPYINTTFKDCTFANGYYLDLSALKAGCTVTLDGCTVDGVKITAEFCGLKCDGNEAFCVELPSGRTLADCVIFK